MLTLSCVALLLSLCAAVCDARTGNIPNKLTLFGFVAALVAHFASGVSFGGLRGGLGQAGLALAGALLCAAIPLLMFTKGAMGGGDVKLFAALGALLHPLGGLEVETYAFVAAAVIVPLKLAHEGTLFRTLGRTVRLVSNPFRPKATRRALPDEMATWFRLGPAIFLGTLGSLVVHAYSWSQVP